MLDTQKIKKDFPILKRLINGNKLVYLDNAATTQKPQVVIDSLVDYYSNHNANIHRGIHTLAEEATEMYEGARKKIAEFLGAESEKEIIYVRNSTEAINLVAYSWGRANLKKGDEVYISESEHHSNIVPWQIVTKETGAVLKYIKVDRDGYLELGRFKRELTPKVKFVSIVHVSNVLGIINPVKELAKMAHSVGAKILVDGSQSAPRIPINVDDLECDFFALTSHKMSGPTGMGVLWGREEILNTMPAFFGGGDMIKEVYFDHFIPSDLPYKFEAGTPNIAGAVGLGTAVDYLTHIGMDNVYQHEMKLTDYTLKKLSEIEGIEIYGPKNTENKIGVIAFNLKGVHAHDLAQMFNEEGIGIRSGHHCAMPLHRDKLHIPASARISIYIYNDESDIDKVVEAIKKAKKIFGLKY